MEAITQEIRHSLLDNHGVFLFIRREDQVHPHISGNKLRKLKYNLEYAREAGLRHLVTFGGAYSSHLLALAHAGREFGFTTTGIVRGDELIHLWRDNPTLAQAHSAGMQFKFITREQYRQRAMPSYLHSLEAELGPCYLLPEGGTNSLAVKGCEEILSPSDHGFDSVCCSVGTGGTLAGIINASADSQRILGFPALKSPDLIKDICKFARKTQWELANDYHFGGYARVSPALIQFINDFREFTGIPLDPVYTGKMMFGIFDMVSKGLFTKGSRILAIHTGGLQGVAGMNRRLKKRNLQLITI